MNHFGMSNEEPCHIIVDATTAAFNAFVRDDIGMNDLSLGTEIFAIPAKEDVASDDEEIHNKKTSVVRKGSNGSPVCVSSFFDDFMGYFTNSGFDSQEDLVVNNNTVVYKDSVEDDENMEFTDPDKLEKAISELCEPILKKERKHDKTANLVGKDMVFKKAKVSTKNVLQAKKNKSFMPLFVMSSQLNVNDQGIVISRMIDDDIAMHPVTPEYQRSTDDTYGEFGPLPQMATQRQLFLPTGPKMARCFAPSSIVRMPMMPHDEEVMVSTQRSLLLLSSVKECALPTTSTDETAAIEAAMRDTSENRFSELHPRMLFDDVPDAKDEHQPENWSCAIQELNKVCKDADSWEKYFSVAQEFRQLHGHCCIPYKYPQDRKFAAWAKRQRYQYTLYKRQQEKVWKPDEKKTALTEERIDALNSIDFIWDIQEAQFELFLVAYCKFQEENGNVSVPKKYKDGLGRWVGSQRSTLRKGKMPLDRFVKLERVGFLWSSHGDPSGELMVQLEEMRGKARLASVNERFKKRA